MNWDDDDTYGAPIVTTRRTDSFVPALPDLRRPPARVEILPPATMPDMPTVTPLSRAQTAVTGNYVDRAHAFSHVTGRLALALGGVAAIVGVVGFHVPVLSLAVLAWFGTAYAGVWLVAYVLYVLVTAEGAAWLHVCWAWAWLGREQKHRHAMEWRQNFPEDYER